MTPIVTPHYRRYWILLLFRATMYSGLGTVSSEKFHRLVYFLNALMPAIGLNAETARVLKQPTGPFFPDYQWDLDRLVGMGHISVVDYRVDDSPFVGKYRITRNGVSFAEKLSLASPFFSTVERGISEIVSAFVSLPSALGSLSVHWDANYGQDTIREGTVVDFGEWLSKNYSQEAAEFLFDTWVQTRRRRQRELVHIVPAPPGALDDFGDDQNRDEHFRGIGQAEHPTWRPGTSSHPHRPAFNLYAHYLVQSLARSLVGNGRQENEHA